MSYFTNVRLEHEVGIYYFPETLYTYRDEKGNEQVNWVSGWVASLLSAGVTAATTGSLTKYQIGDILSFSREQTREFTEKYSLGKYAFQPEAMIPQKVKTSLTIEKAVLRTSGNFLELFGMLPGNLIEQQKPFVILESWTDTTQKNNAFYTSYVIYNGCWFENNPVDYDTTDANQAIIQEVKVRVTDVSSYSPLMWAFPNMMLFGIPTIIAGIKDFGIKNNSWLNIKKRSVLI